MPEVFRLRAGKVGFSYGPRVPLLSGRPGNAFVSPRSALRLRSYMARGIPISAAA